MNFESEEEKNETEKIKIESLKRIILKRIIGELRSECKSIEEKIKKVVNLIVELHEFEEISEEDEKKEKLKDLIEMALRAQNIILDLSFKLDEVTFEIKKGIGEMGLSVEDRKKATEYADATIAKLYAEGKLAPERIKVIAEYLEKKGEIERAKRLREILKGE